MFFLNSGLFPCSVFFVVTNDGLKSPVYNYDYCQVKKQKKNKTKEMLYLRVFVLFLVQISLWIVNNDNAGKQQYYIQQMTNPD